MGFWVFGIYGFWVFRIYGFWDLRPFFMFCDNILMKKVSNSIKHKINLCTCGDVFRVLGFLGFRVFGFLGFRVFGIYGFRVFGIYGPFLCFMTTF